MSLDSFAYLRLGPLGVPLIPHRLVEVGVRRAPGQRVLELVAEDDRTRADMREGVSDGPLGVSDGPLGRVCPGMATTLICQLARGC